MDSKPKRILIAGFQHETNTFAPTKADWSAFVGGVTAPPMLRGAAMIARHGGTNISIGGFITAANERGWTLVPSCWAGAVPSAHVTEDAFERIAGEIVADVKKAVQEGIDGIYLDLHGAGVAEHVDDLEGELITRLRAVTGPDMPLVASLDMHANVSDAMLNLTDALVGYRTYPHVDKHSTGLRAAELMARRLARGTREPMHVRRLPFLLAINVQSTFMEPAKSVYLDLEALDTRHDVMLTFATGFPAADVEFCGPLVWGYGADEAAVTAAVDTLYQRIEQPRDQWRLDIHTPAEAVKMAIAHAASVGDKAGPVVISDTQDNPGAGADTNTTGMLHALLAGGAGKAFPGRVGLGLMYDPEAAAAAHAAGVGAQVTLSLGRSVMTHDGLSDAPVTGTFTVKALGAGDPLPKGPMSMGSRINLGPCACLEIEGVRVMVGSGKAQMLDREIFRHVGIEPETMAILVNKSSVHFRADFAPIASLILVAKAKGPVAADPADLPWKKISPATALRP